MIQSFLCIAPPEGRKCRKIAGNNRGRHIPVGHAGGTNPRIEDNRTDAGAVAEDKSL